jgi:hypothetical protein
MSQDRRPLPACVHMTEVKIASVGSGETKLLGKIAQALLIKVTIARRKPAMLSEKSKLERGPNSPRSIEAFRPRNLIEIQTPDLDE